MTVTVNTGTQLVGNGTYVVGQQLFQGGEGTVFAVRGRSDVLIKTYFARIGQKRHDQLQALTRAATPGLTSLSAWPTEVLYLTRSGEPVAILMPAIRDAKPLYVMQVPQTRLQQDPRATFSSLVAIALNLAHVVSLFHAAGIVIGDLSAANVLTLNTCEVRLIDCDSMQIPGYPCVVGLMEMLPPELQGQNLGSLARTANHDAFALAVLIYQLLYVGRHPYAGVGRLSVPETIRTGIDPLRADLMQKQQRLTGLALDDVMSARIASLFRQAFTSRARPTALDWAHALKAFHGELAVCSRNSAHEYRCATGCPWCRLEAAGQVSFFAPMPMPMPVPAVAPRPARATTRAHSPVTAHRPQAYPAAAPSPPPSSLVWPQWAPRFNRQMVGPAILAVFAIIGWIEVENGRRARDYAEKLKPARVLPAVPRMTADKPKKKRPTTTDQHWSAGRKPVPEDYGRLPSEDTEKQASKPVRRKAKGHSRDPEVSPSTPIKRRGAWTDSSGIPWGSSPTDLTRPREPYAWPAQQRPPVRNPPPRRCHDLIDVVDGCLRQHR